ncbi:hypothetical protein Btru_036451, partial [Bulinus truncatus]
VVKNIPDTNVRQETFHVTSNYDKGSEDISNLEPAKDISDTDDQEDVPPSLLPESVCDLSSSISSAQQTPASTNSATKLSNKLQFKLASDPGSGKAKVLFQLSRSTKVNPLKLASDEEEEVKVAGDVEEEEKQILEKTSAGEYVPTRFKVSKKHEMFKPSQAAPSLTILFNSSAIISTSSNVMTASSTEPAQSIGETEPEESKSSSTGKQVDTNEKLDDESKHKKDEVSGVSLRRSDRMAARRESRDDERKKEEGESKSSRSSQRQDSTSRRLRDRQRDDLDRRRDSDEKGARRRSSRIKSDDSDDKKSKHDDVTRRQSKQQDSSMRIHRRTRSSRRSRSGSKERGRKSPSPKRNTKSSTSVKTSEKASLKSEGKDESTSSKSLDISSLLDNSESAAEKSDNSNLKYDDPHKEKNSKDSDTDKESIPVLKTESAASIADEASKTDLNEVDVSKKHVQKLVIRRSVETNDFQVTRNDLADFNDQDSKEKHSPTKRKQKDQERDSSKTSAPDDDTDQRTGDRAHRVTPKKHHGHRKDASKHGSQKDSHRRRHRTGSSGTEDDAAEKDAVQKKSPREKEVPSKSRHLPFNYDEPPLAPEQVLVDVSAIPGKSKWELDDEEEEDANPESSTLHSIYSQAKVELQTLPANNYEAPEMSWRRSTRLQADRTAKNRCIGAKVRHSSSLEEDVDHAKSKEKKKHKSREKKTKKKKKRQEESSAEENQESLEKHMVKKVADGKESRSKSNEDKPLSEVKKKEDSVKTKTDIDTAKLVTYLKEYSEKEEFTFKEDMAKAKAEGDKMKIVNYLKEYSKMSTDLEQAAVAEDARHDFSEKMDDSKEGIMSETPSEVCVSVSEKLKNDPVEKMSVSEGQNECVDSKTSERGLDRSELSKSPELKEKRVISKALERKKKSGSAERVKEKDERSPSLDTARERRDRSLSFDKSSEKGDRSKSLERPKERRDRSKSLERSKDRRDRSKSLERSKDRRDRSKSLERPKEGRDRSKSLERSKDRRDCSKSLERPKDRRDRSKSLERPKDRRDRSKSSERNRERRNRSKSSEKSKDRKDRSKSPEKREKRVWSKSPEKARERRERSKSLDRSRDKRERSKSKDRRDRSKSLERNRERRDRSKSRERRERSRSIDKYRRSQMFRRSRSPWRMKGRRNRSRSGSAGRSARNRKNRSRSRSRSYERGSYYRRHRSPGRGRRDRDRRERSDSRDRQSDQRKRGCSEDRQNAKQKQPSPSPERRIKKEKDDETQPEKNATTACDSLVKTAVVELFSGDIDLSTIPIPDEIPLPGEEVKPKEALKMKVEETADTIIVEPMDISDGETSDGHDSVVQLENVLSQGEPVQQLNAVDAQISAEPSKSDGQVTGKDKQIKFSIMGSVKKLRSMAAPDLVLNEPDTQVTLSKLSVINNETEVVRSDQGINSGQPVKEGGADLDTVKSSPPDEKDKVEKSLDVDESDEEGRAGSQTGGLKKPEAKPDAPAQRLQFKYIPLWEMEETEARPVVESPKKLMKGALGLALDYGSDTSDSEANERQDTGGLHSTEMLLRSSADKDKNNCLKPAQEDSNDQSEALALESEPKDEKEEIVVSNPENDAGTSLQCADSNPSDDTEEAKDVAAQQVSSLLSTQTVEQEAYSPSHPSLEDADDILEAYSCPSLIKLPVRSEEGPKNIQQSSSSSFGLITSIPFPVPSIATSLNVLPLKQGLTSGLSSFALPVAPSVAPVAVNRSAVDVPLVAYPRLPLSALAGISQSAPVLIQNSGASVKDISSIPLPGASQPQVSPAQSLACSAQPGVSSVAALPVTYPILSLQSSAPALPKPVPPPVPPPASANTSVPWVQPVSSASASQSYLGIQGIQLPPLTGVPPVPNLGVAASLPQPVSLPGVQIPQVLPVLPPLPQQLQPPGQGALPPVLSAALPPIIQPTLVLPVPPHQAFTLSDASASNQQLKESDTPSVKYRINRFHQGPAGLMAQQAIPPPSVSIPTLQPPITPVPVSVVNVSSPTIAAMKPGIITTKKHIKDTEHHPTGTQPSKRPKISSILSQPKIEDPKILELLTKGEADLKTLPVSLPVCLTDSVKTEASEKQDIGRNHVDSEPSLQPQQPRTFVDINDSCTKPEDEIVKKEISSLNQEEMISSQFGTLKQDETAFTDNSAIKPDPAQLKSTEGSLVLSENIDFDMFSIPLPDDTPKSNVSPSVPHRTENHNIVEPLPSAPPLPSSPLLPSEPSSSTEASTEISTDLPPIQQSQPLLLDSNTSTSSTDSVSLSAKSPISGNLLAERKKRFSQSPLAIGMLPKVPLTQSPLAIGPLPKLPPEPDEESPKKGFISHESQGRKSLATLEIKPKLTLQLSSSKTKQEEPKSSSSGSKIQIFLKSKSAVQKTLVRGFEDDGSDEDFAVEESVQPEPVIESDNNLVSAFREDSEEPLDSSAFISGESKAVVIKEEERETLEQTVSRFVKPENIEAFPVQVITSSRNEENTAASTWPEFTVGKEEKIEEAGDKKSGKAETRDRDRKREQRDEDSERKLARDDARKRNAKDSEGRESRRRREEEGGSSRRRDEDNYDDRGKRKVKKEKDDEDYDDKRRSDGRGSDRHRRDDYSRRRSRDDDQSDYSRRRGREEEDSRSRRRSHHDKEENRKRQKYNEGSSRYSEREKGRERSKERDQSRDRDRSRERDHSKERERSTDREKGFSRSRQYGKRNRDRSRSRSRSPARKRERNRSLERDRSRERNISRERYDRNRDREDRSRERDRSQECDASRSRSRSIDRERKTHDEHTSSYSSKRKDGRSFKEDILEELSKSSSTPDGQNELYKVTAIGSSYAPEYPPETRPYQSDSSYLTDPNLYQGPPASVDIPPTYVDPNYPGQYPPTYEHQHYASPWQSQPGHEHYGHDVAGQYQPLPADHPYPFHQPQNAHYQIPPPPFQAGPYHPPLGLLPPAPALHPLPPHMHPSALHPPNIPPDQHIHSVPPLHIPPYNQSGPPLTLFPQDSGIHYLPSSSPFPPLTGSLQGPIPPPRGPLLQNQRLSNIVTETVPSFGSPRFPSPMQVKQPEVKTVRKSRFNQPDEQTPTDTSSWPIVSTSEPLKTTKGEDESRKPSSRVPEPSFENSSLAEAEFDVSISKEVKGKVKKRSSASSEDVNEPTVSSSSVEDTTGDTGSDSGTDTSFQRPLKVKSRWRRNSEAEAVVDTSTHPQAPLPHTSSKLASPPPDSSPVEMRRTRSRAAAEELASIPSIETPPPPPPPRKRIKQELDSENVDDKTGEEMKTEEDSYEGKEEDFETIVKHPDFPKFEIIDENIHLTERKCSKSMKRMLCDCTTSREDRAMGMTACGSDCLNRMLMIECGSRCPCGEYCTNRRFQKKDYARTIPFSAGDKGWGLRADQDMEEKGTFIMEYVGELLDYEEFVRRTRQYSKEGLKHHYFMALNADEVVDATLRGNISRFINHSCNPNCETQKWTVNGELRVGFFTRTPVKKGEELTFDYQFEHYGEPQKCYCGSENCRGYIGLVKSPTRNNKKKEKKKREIFKDELLEEDIEKLSLLDGMRNKNNVLELCRLMVRAEKVQHRMAILKILQNTTEAACLRLFLDYHGLPLFWSWMADIGTADYSEDTQELKLLMFVDVTAGDNEAVATSEEPQTADEAVVPAPELEPSTSSSDTTPPSSPSPALPLPVSTVTPVSILASAKDSKEAKQKRRVTFAEVHVETSFSPEPPEEDMEENDNITSSTQYTDENNDLSNEGMSSGGNKVGMADSTSQKDIFDLGDMSGVNSDTDNSDSELVNRDPLASLAAECISQWSSLKEVFKIPKKERVEERKRTERELDVLSKKQPEASDPFAKWKKGRPRAFVRKKSAEEDEKKSNLPKMSKEERRQRFEAQVKAEDEMAAQAAAEEYQRQQEAYMLHQQRLMEDPAYFYNYHLPQGEYAGMDPSMIPPEGLIDPVTGQPIPPEALIDPQTGQHFHGSTGQQVIDPTTGHPVLHIDPNTGQPVLPIDPSTGQPFIHQIDPHTGQAIDPLTGQPIHQMDPHTGQPILPSVDLTTGQAVHQIISLAGQQPIDPLTGQPLVQPHVHSLDPLTGQVPDSAIDPLTGHLIQHSVLSYSTALPFDSHQPSQAQVQLAPAAHLPATSKTSSALSELEMEEEVPPPPSPPTVPVTKLPPNWKTAKDNEGRIYYYHAFTRQTQWEMPTWEDDEDSLNDMELDALPPEDIIRSKKKTTTAAADTSSEVARKIKDSFRIKMSDHIILYLNPYRKKDCKVGRISSTEDFKHLARKLTHHVMSKELKHCRHVEDLEVNENVKAKAKDYVRKYMSKFGSNYRKSSSPQPD